MVTFEQVQAKLRAIIMLLPTSTSDPGLQSIISDLRRQENELASLASIPTPASPQLAYAQAVALAPALALAEIILVAIVAMMAIMMLSLQLQILSHRAQQLPAAIQALMSLIQEAIQAARETRRQLEQSAPQAAHCLTHIDEIIRILLLIYGRLGTAVGRSGSPPRQFLEGLTALAAQVTAALDALLHCVSQIPGINPRDVQRLRDLLVGPRGRITRILGDIADKIRLRSFGSGAR